MKSHNYEISLDWRGNLGSGTSEYRAYSRAHELSKAGEKGAKILGSSDPAFRGDAEKWNPEELLLASLAACHMLWFLHLAADAGVVVEDYADAPTGRMDENSDGSGQFSEVVLRPKVAVKSPEMAEKLHDLHEKAHEMCFIARSMNFPVRCEMG